MSHIVTREEADKGRSCDLCGERFEEREKVVGGRGGTLLGVRWEGRIVIVHVSCSEKHQFA